MGVRIWHFAGAEKGGWRVLRAVFCAAFQLFDQLSYSSSARFIYHFDLREIRNRSARSKSWLGKGLPFSTVSTSQAINDNTITKGDSKANLTGSGQPENQAISMPEEHTKREVLFVGSIPLKSSQDTFRCLAQSGLNLHSIPDGEPATRGAYVRWQEAVFSQCPHVLRNSPASGKSIQPSGPIALNPTGYADAAIASYADFCKLRNDGVIPSGLRFQVCVPTPMNPIAIWVRPEYQAEVESLYEKQLKVELRQIQDSIPAKDLAMQWDSVVEIGILENAPAKSAHLADGEGTDARVWNIASKCVPWFSPVKENLVDRYIRLATYIDKEVPLGFHLCYGDVVNQHIVPLADPETLIDIANAIISLVDRRIEWIHMPVPKHWNTASFYEPLKTLKLNGTKLVLGLVHAHDLAGTEDRIRLAAAVLKDFGIATECGLGRAAIGEFESVLEILAKATS